MTGTHSNDPPAPRRLGALIDLVDRHAPGEGITWTPIEHLGLYRTSIDLPRTPELEAPAIVVLLQGTKICYSGGRVERYVGPRVIVGLFPAPVETEFVETSADHPFLAAGIHLDTSRLAELLLRIDAVEDSDPAVDSPSTTSKFSLPLTDDLVAPFIRLVAALDNPRDTAVLGPAALDEIYYRLLCGDKGPDLRALLQQNTRVKRISRAVEHIHDHLDAPISVEELATKAHMSRTAFYTAFREVMKVSPLQYSKSVKLLEAQRLLHEGRRVSEAGYQVGYSNLGQFSREFKRQFGHSPSTFSLEFRRSRNSRGAE